jgi:hypothetical protein
VRRAPSPSKETLTYLVDQILLFWRCGRQEASTTGCGIRKNPPIVCRVVGAGIALTVDRKFPGGLRTKFYWRPRDYRSKIVCEWYDNRRNPRLSCFPLSDLHVRRDGPLLYLCCPTVRGSSTCWTSLNFTSYECKFRPRLSSRSWLTGVGLVIFHCTVLSLRSHDTTSHLGNLHHDLDGEALKFAGSGLDLRHLEVPMLIMPGRSVTVVTSTPCGCTVIRVPALFDSKPLSWIRR